MPEHELLGTAGVVMATRRHVYKDLLGNSLSFGIGMSVFVIFGYYAFIKFGQSMGFKGQLAPILSAWLGNIVFFIGGIVLLIKARK